MSRNDELNEIKEKIENMDKKDHIEILNIFKKFPNIILNENNNGTFINISDLDNKILDELKKYINYIDTQKQFLEKDETKKNQLENKFFKLS
jgi:hypothetical protein